MLLSLLFSPLNLYIVQIGFIVNTLERIKKFTDFDPLCKSVRTFCLVTKYSAFGGSKYQTHESQLANLCGLVSLSSTHLIPGHYSCPLSHP